MSVSRPISKTMRLNIELERDTVTRLKVYIIKKYGTIKGHISPTIEEAINFFLNRVESPGVETPAAPPRGEDKRPNKAAPGNPGENNGEKTKTNSVEQFYFDVADKDPYRALLLLFGDERKIPVRILFGSYEMLLVTRGFSKEGAKKFLRKLIDKGVYKQNASLLILSRREENV